jgi:NAD-dependent SIR2 family protein deacetylase
MRHLPGDPEPDMTGGEALHSVVARAADAVDSADALLISAGAGMGVDSGLPDFRGPEGFWKAYPHLEARGLDFYAMANPQTFIDEPTLAWQFYGHRQRLYRDTEPHAGFRVLLDWCRTKPGGYFVFTSNVDGHFQKAGFAEERIVECHGNIFALQCQRPCSDAVWSVEEPVDYRGELPRCPRCNGPARPNVLMFGDFGWVACVSDAQHRRYRDWLRAVAGKRVVVIEIGAGLAVPTVRMESEMLASELRATLIRINPRDPQAPRGSMPIATGGLDAIRQIAHSTR